MARISAIEDANRKASPSVTLKSSAGLVILVVLALVSAASAKQSFQPMDVVGKLQHVTFRGFLTWKCATAWCVSPECDVLVTNYHVAKIVGSNATIKGVHISEVASATSEHDPDAHVLPTAAGPLKLAYGRDIALLTMKHPLTQKGMHAVAFYVGRLHPGQKVTMIGFPGGKLDSVVGHFTEEYSEGLLRFEVERELAEGFSGGLIVDEEGRAVGMVFAGGPDRHSAYAIPVWSLADFIRKTKPQLYANLFRGELYRGEEDRRVSQDRPDETSVDVFGLNFPASQDEGFSPNPVLAESYLLLNDRVDNTPIERYNASGAVLALRRTAQLMSQQMKNFVARQTLLFSNARAWQHELQLVDGAQRFRPLNGGKDRFELPIEGMGPVPGSEWADLVKTIGFDSVLAVQFERDVTIENQIVKVFRYQVRPEDQICQLRVKRPFRKMWKGSLPCSGAIWTDEQFSILRITQDMTPPEETGLAGFRIVILYGWWGQRLVPAEIYVRSLTVDAKSYASRGKFDNYRVFAATTRIAFQGHALQVETGDAPGQQATRR